MKTLINYFKETKEEMNQEVLDWIKELYKIRVDNGQNRFFVLFLMFLKIIKFYLKKLIRI
jgi:hypothetical protein